MKESAKSYKLTIGGDRPSELTLKPEPVFRLGKQGDGVVLDGAIFLWDGRGRPTWGGRPGVPDPGRGSGPRASGGTNSPRSRPGRLSATRRGQAALAADGAWSHIPADPRRTEARRYAAAAAEAVAMPWPKSSAPRTISGTGDGAQLRLLPKPISRYGKTGATPEDGALFAFVLGTDPGVVPLHRGRPGDDGPVWQYSFAPMTCWALKAEHKGRPSGACPTATATYPFEHSIAVWTNDEPGDDSAAATLPEPERPATDGNPAKGP